MIRDNAYIGAQQRPGTHECDRRVFWLEQAKAAMGPPPIEDQLLRLMRWVGTVLKTQPTHNRLRHPIAVLDSGAAWCDQQVRAFLCMASCVLGLDVRETALYHTDGQNGHTVAEVRYDNAWHLFDVHHEHAAVYRHPSSGVIMDRDGVADNLGAVLKEGHWWRGTNGIGKEGFYMPGSGFIRHRYLDTDMIRTEVEAQSVAGP